MSWILLVTASILLTSIARILQKKIYIGTKLSSEVAAVIFQLFTGTIILCFAVLNGLTFKGLEHHLANLVLLTLLYTGMNYFLFKAFKQSEAGTVTVIFSSSSAWVLIASAVFLGEAITALKVLGILIIFVAVVGLTLESGKLIIDRKLAYPLIAALLIALAFVNDIYLTERADLLSFLSVAFLLPGIASILLILPGKKYQELYALNRIDYLKNISLSVCYALSTIFVYQAYRLGAQASVISPLTQLSIFLTVIMSYFLLKERKNFRLKMLTSLLAVAGGVILTLA